MHELDVITGIHGFAAVMTVVELLMKYIEHKRNSYAHHYKENRHHGHNPRNHH